MENVVKTEIMRALDRYLMDVIGMPGVVLMENAARAVTDAACVCGRDGLTVVMIGPGNNGGDGLAVLRQLASMGRNAIGLMLADGCNFSGDARINYDVVKKLHLPLTDDISVLEDAEIIIDAVLGTGLSRNVEGRAKEAIELANSLAAYRIAVDIPSGMNGNSGEIMGTVFDADETVTFLALKRGLILTHELEKIGKLSVAPIAMLDEEKRAELQCEQLVDRSFVDSLLTVRKRVTNKGSYGKALLIVGSIGMVGAAIMASRACMRTGAGMTKALIPRDIAPSFACVPEIMTAIDDQTDVSEALLWANAVLIGCGVGNDENKRKKLLAVLECGKPAVIDADGLNTLDDELKNKLKPIHILTPHPGEMARLSGLDIASVLSDPVNTALDFSRKYGCIVVLKNAVSVIAEPSGRLRYNAAGNTGLAKGGSGDCLAGIITALIAQGILPFDAASAGAFILGSSADTALELLKTRALAASDVIAALGIGSNEKNTTRKDS